MCVCASVVTGHRPPTHRLTASQTRNGAFLRRKGLVCLPGPGRKGKGSDADSYEEGFDSFDAGKEDDDNECDDDDECDDDGDTDDDDDEVEEEGDDDDDDEEEEAHSGVDYDEHDEYTIEVRGHVQV